MTAKTATGLRRHIDPYPVSEAEIRSAQEKIRSEEKEKIEAARPDLSDGLIGYQVGCLLSFFGFAGIMSFFSPVARLVKAANQSIEDALGVYVSLGGFVFLCLFCFLVLVMPSLVGHLVASRMRAGELRSWHVTKRKMEREFSAERDKNVAGELAFLEERSGQEAQEATRRLEEIQCEAENSVDHLSEMVDRTDSELDRAEKEFSERAFEPFWDCMTRAAENMVEYDSGARNLVSIGNKYCHLLESRSHSFPKTLATSRVARSPWASLERLSFLTRKGQRDYEFASIWAHKETRRVLAGGFSNLDAAIRGIRSGLSWSIDHSTSVLEGAFLDIGADVTLTVIYSTN